ncbi:Uncharacterized protein FKW44_001779 [Caligus rogercresseyi]|uniref:BED-type domain-containing protein n=1 Tax=Caligus rogercresseyi TaxID=217165 RepID=A0A7T8KJ69_CALRO|nr:Uncharacterized protein FKW44_001779 [Caligus rogercresseyi]
MEVMSREMAISSPEELVLPSFDKWKYKQYFEFHGWKDSRNIHVTCRLCRDGKILSTARNSTSNLLKHLESIHKNEDLVATCLTNTPQTRKRRKYSELNGEELKGLVSAYIVEDMLPLSTVDSPTFRAIIKKIPLSPSVKLPYRKAYTSWLDRKFTSMESALKSSLEGIEFVSTTADLWTANNKSFLGVTVHWIDNITLKRRKGALACKRVMGRHTFNVIASEISRVHSFFGLERKVVATVTDNATNFVKAFKIYQSLDKAETDLDEEIEEDFHVPNNLINFEDISETLSMETDANILLPPHYRCASHTLNIISSTDIEKFLTSRTETKLLYRGSISKCSALWNKCSRSSLASECLEELNLRKLLVPTNTRWNSFYEGIKRITEIPKAQRKSLFLKLGIKCLSEREYDFLVEYTRVMNPLARGLDILQGDDCHYGTLLPTLEAITLTSLTLKDSLVFTKELVDFIINCIINSKDALLAAISHPKFKLRWLNDENRREEAKRLLIEECRKLTVEETPNKKVHKAENNDFFVFHDEYRDTYSADNEVINYLKAENKIEVLEEFSTVKKIFIKYNTPTPSSAPVERLFSLGGQVLTPKRNRLSDGRFERLLILRYNYAFTKES